ncbi:MAG: NAD-dependent epimerase/dehydratase family protein [Candidatus Dormibacteraceae bacterium]
MPAAPDPKRALVTGATGFVGANLVRRLLEEKHEVSLLVRENHDSWRLADISDQVRWIQTGIDDAAGLGMVIAEFKPQWVFHLAAHGAYSWQNDPAAIWATNVIGTANLVAACLAVGFEAFVNTGSSSEYGLKDHAPREDEPVEPNSPYAVAKAAATLFCAQTARDTGAPITTLRLYSVYGPWEEPRRFIPQLVACGLKGRLPPLANPNTARDYVYVDDVCDAYLRVAREGRQARNVYNVGTGVQTTLRQAVELARRVLAIEPEPQWQSMPDRRWDTNVWVADKSAIEADLGWRASIALEDGLRLTADWLATNPAVADRYRAASS